MGRISWTKEGLDRWDLEHRFGEEIADVRSLFREAFSALTEERRTALIEHGTELGYSITLDGGITRVKPFSKPSYSDGAY